MPSIELDPSDWPILRVRFEGTASDAEFDAYLTALTELLDRPGRTVTVIDSTLSGISSASQRRKQAEWLRTHESVIRERSAGTAFVISSFVQRSVLSAIFWLQPLPHAHVVVGTLAEAMDWAREQLRRRGVETHA